MSSDADVEVLRDALAPLRFPLLLASSTWGLVVLMNALGPLVGFAWGASQGFLPPMALVQIGVVLVVHGVAMVPAVLLLRAAIAGFQSRGDPSRLVALARLHERAWTWMGGLVGLLVVLVLLAVLLVGC